mmetsp:Transcript_22461/g.36325  ORF Transcript_22461/g.36325 Transcript_22461/m.36325 type:complete len:202 (+) Transcript_22461:248-853(+)
MSNQSQTRLRRDINTMFPGHRPFRLQRPDAGHGCEGLGVGHANADDAIAEVKGKGSRLACHIQLNDRQTQIGFKVNDGHLAIIGPGCGPRDRSGHGPARRLVPIRTDQRLHCILGQMQCHVPPIRQDGGVQHLGQLGCNARRQVSAHSGSSSKYGASVLEPNAPMSLDSAIAADDIMAGPGNGYPGNSRVTFCGAVSGSGW